MVYPEADASRVINQIRVMTDHSWLVTRLRNTFLILSEIACYLGMILLIFFSIWLPNSSLTGSEQLNSHVNVNISIEIVEMVNFFLVLKILIGILGALLIIPAILFRKIRKKNNTLEEIHDLATSYVKQHNPVVK
ncbi:MAG: hypothetical protein JST26_05355 [Bacteroidetes bacterium]|nr:hypothetical protein [Bacteroidota bacterium]